VKEGRKPSDCLKHHVDELPEECQSLRKATFECKRGMVCPFLQFHSGQVDTKHMKLDMRKRFRGNIVGTQYEYTPKEADSA